MKKIIAFAIAAIVSLGAAAQDIYVGGSIGAWRNGTDHVTTMGILPEIGYNLSDKTAIGTTIGWSHYHDSSKVTTNLFQIEPYYRYSFFKSGIVSLFVDGTAGVGVGRTSYDGENGKAAVTWEIGLKPGISVALSEKCSVVAHVGMLGYQGANHAAKDGGADEGWGLRLSGNNLTFGFYYTF